MSAHLTLRPDRCNECGKCVSACPKDAIRVGKDYILVDWHACNQCSACVEVCDANAIQRAFTPARSAGAATTPSSDITKVVVGSRAEAKALHKAAKRAEKQAARGGGRVVPLPVAVGAAAAAAPEVGSVPAQALGPAAAHVAGPVLQDAAASSQSAGAAELAAGASARTGRSQRAAAAYAADAAQPRRAQPADATERLTHQSDMRAWLVPGAAWTLADVLVILAVLLVSLIAKNAVLALPAVALMPVAGRAFTRAGVLTIYYGIQIAALVLLASRHGCSVAQAFGFRRAKSNESATPDAERPSPVTSALLTVGMLAGVEVVAVGYGLIAQAIGWRQPMTLSTDVSSVFGGGGVGLALSVLLVALVAPVAEELAFRGVILPATGTRWGQWPAILISAALFAAYHLNLWLFVPMLALGTALGWLTVARRSLWPAIALHILYNTLAVAAAFLVPR